MFLFNSNNKLLLQQRASHKVTFPNVWTNTCCSHPLFGCQPSEIDNSESILDGTVYGIKTAAIRKLHQELGITPDQIKIQDFKFISRIHYCAKDQQQTSTSSPSTSTSTLNEVQQWGEHEIDYLLVIRADVNCNLNLEEVQAIKYVNSSELQEMIHPESGLKWSPWFRIIVKEFLLEWFEDLDTLFTSDKYVNLEEIRRFI